MTTHAGTVVFRGTSSRPLFLIVSSSDRAHWVLPKGHIQTDESPEAAALRELREEAGVNGEIIDRLAIEEFETEKEKLVVQYFLVKESGPCQPKESRMIRWESENSALRLLSFEESKRALLQGANRIKALQSEDSG